MASSENPLKPVGFLQEGGQRKDVQHLALSFSYTRKNAEDGSEALLG